MVSLVGGVGGEPVGRVDDLSLTDLTAGRFGCVTLGERRILHSRHGVHGVHEGGLPAVGSQPTDLTGEPVMGVDQVEPALGAGGSGAHDARGKGAQLAWEVVLGQALIGAGQDVVDGDPGREFDGGRQASGRGAGEDLDFASSSGQAAGDLGDVDIHATGVAGAGLFQG